MTENTKPAPAIAAIIAESAPLDAQAAPPVPELAPPSPEESQRQQQQVALWAMVPRTFGSVLAMAMPELADVYNEQACNLWGEAMVPVAKKYGWDIDENSPEVALFVVSTPFILGTGMAIMRRKRGGGTAPGAAAGAASQPRPPRGGHDLAAQAGPVPQMNAEPA